MKHLGDSASTGRIDYRPSTTAISSSVNPYNSYTSASICLSVVSACGVALADGLDVRRRFGGELFVQVQHALDQGDHPVVAGDVGGGGEVDDALRCERDNALVGRSERVATQNGEKVRANAENWVPIFGLRLHSTSVI